MKASRADDRSKNPDPRGGLYIPPGKWGKFSFAALREGTMSLLPAAHAMEVVLRMEDTARARLCALPLAYPLDEGPPVTKLDEMAPSHGHLLCALTALVPPEKFGHDRQTNRRADGTVEPSSNFRASNPGRTLRKYIRCPARPDWGETEQARRGQTAFE